MNGTLELRGDRRLSCEGWSRALAESSRIVWYSDARVGVNLVLLVGRDLGRKTMG